jgi:hypothetical protein
VANSLWGAYNKNFELEPEKIKELVILSKVLK